MKKNKMDSLLTKYKNIAGNSDKKLFRDVKSGNFIKSKKAKEELNRRIEKANNPVNIYAELSKKQLLKLASGDAVLEFPYGTTINYKTGSRVLNLTCDNMHVAQELIEGLEASYINWQII